MNDTIQALLRVLREVVAILEELAPEALHAELTGAAQRRQKAIAEGEAAARFGPEP